MRHRGTMQVVSPGKRTTFAEGSSMKDAYVVDWDKVPGYNQHRDRIDEREAMGQKKTPVGRTRLKGD